MSDFTAQAALTTSPPVLFPSTLTAADNRSAEALLPWLTADGEPIYVQIDEEENTEYVCS